MVSVMRGESVRVIYAKVLFCISQFDGRGDDGITRSDLHAGFPDPVTVIPLVSWVYRLCSGYLQYPVTGINGLGSASSEVLFFPVSGAPTPELSVGGFS